MEININGKATSILVNFTVNDLLEKKKMSKCVAVFVNGKQLLLSEYQSYKLKENDNVKIFKPLSGG